MRLVKMELPFRCGDEYDWLTGWRKVLAKKPGRRKATKRRYRKRCRLHAKKKLISCA